jgi:hypothetical protein
MPSCHSPARLATALPCAAALDHPGAGTWASYGEGRVINATDLAEVVAGKLDWREVVHVEDGSRLNYNVVIIEPGFPIVLEQEGLARLFDELRAAYHHRRFTARDARSDAALFAGYADWVVLAVASPNETTYCRRSVAPDRNVPGQAHRDHS